jgi:hypothetical protein
VCGQVCVNCTLFILLWYSLFCYPRNIRCWMLLKALWTHVICWFVQRTSCELHVLCLSGTLLSVTPSVKDLTCGAIGLYSDCNNKSYVVYFWAFLLPQTSQTLYVQCISVNTDADILYILIFQQKSKTYSEAWKSSSNIVTKTTTSLC